MDIDPPKVAADILSGVNASKSVLCTLLAFLESVWEDVDNTDSESETLRAIQKKVVKGNGVVAQGRRVPKHLQRFGLPTDNFSGDKSGRKTPQAIIVIPRLVEYLESLDFDNASTSDKIKILHLVSEPFRSNLGVSLGPMRVTRSGKSDAAVIQEILDLAEQRTIGSAIAELLVGCKLEVCLSEPDSSLIAKQHKWETGHDDPKALGDYRIENVAFEITMVRQPDQTHRSKANKITKVGTDECWLIVRSDKIKEWQEYIAKAPSKYPGLIRCYGISEFVGQNLWETRRRTREIHDDPLNLVVQRLNELVAEHGKQFLPAAHVELQD